MFRFHSYYIVVSKLNAGIIHYSIIDGCLFELSNMFKKFMQINVLAPNILYPR